MRSITWRGEDWLGQIIVLYMRWRYSEMCEMPYVLLAGTLYCKGGGSFADGEAAARCEGR